MKTFIYSIATIICTLALMLVVSLLFDLLFIQQHTARQVTVWILMFTVFFVGFRLLQEINKPTN